MTRINISSDERTGSDVMVADVEQRGTSEPGAAAANSPGGTFRTQVTHGSISQRSFQTYRIHRTIYFVFGLLEGLLAIRFLLKLFGANPNAPFTALTYGVTEPFIGFFRNIFPASESGVGVLETESMIALIIYGLLGWAIGQVVILLFDRD